MDIGRKLRRLTEEDLIWVIYFFIAIAAIVSNHFERRFLFNESGKDQKKFKFLNITIFVVAFFIYLYFVLVKYENVQTLKKDASKSEIITAHVTFVASILFLIGGILFLLSEIKQDTPPDDIGLI